MKEKKSTDNIKKYIWKYFKKFNTGTEIQLYHRNIVHVGISTLT